MRDRLHLARPLSLPHRDDLQAYTLFVGIRKRQSLQEEWMDRSKSFDKGIPLFHILTNAQRDLLKKQWSNTRLNDDSHRLLSHKG